MENPNHIIPVFYSCYANQTRDGEQFIPEHLFSYQIAGQLALNDGVRSTMVINEGDFIFCKRNSLVKSFKQPPEKDAYKALTLFIDQQSLHKFANDYDVTPTLSDRNDAVIKLKPNGFYKGFMESLTPYQQLPLKGNEALLNLKLQEGVSLLLKYDPELRSTLFDFSEPGKIDLAGFMAKNFRFKISIAKFAYLSGRSLATFKRDFVKIFNTTPERWLRKARLEEAYYLIKEQHKRSSDVYLEVGFETLAHFSHSFKQHFGVNPSDLHNDN